jgi:hypothetical protein
MRWLSPRCFLKAANLSRKGRTEGDPYLTTYRPRKLIHRQRPTPSIRFRSLFVPWMGCPHPPNACGSLRSKPETETKRQKVCERQTQVSFPLRVNFLARGWLRPPGPPENESRRHHGFGVWGYPSKGGLAPPKGSRFSVLSVYRREKKEGEKPPRRRAPSHSPLKSGFLIEHRRSPVPRRLGAFSIIFPDFPGSNPPVSRSRPGFPGISCLLFYIT